MKNFLTYRERREQLLNKINHVHADKEGGIVVLLADFEGERTAFRQESSFYYYTGIAEPGVALVMDRAGKTTLYVPNCGAVRDKWVKAPIKLSPEMADTLHVDEVATLGDVCGGYQLYPFFEHGVYANLNAVLQAHVGARHPIFTLCPQAQHGYLQQRLTLMRLAQLIPGLQEHLVDISPLVARMRRIKSKHEIELIYQAVQTTMLAQHAAARAIGDGMPECEVQAHLEFMMTGGCQRPAFPSIVGSGANSTILHYTQNDGVMEEGDLVVVDVGAEYEYYCGDITRTYPVSGSFTERQKQVYMAVLETQEYIAGLAKPGYWLSNNEHPEQSLNHLARAFLEERGYSNYFPHGIGHYLGMDVHDVGDYDTPLESGDVITIEPGIYIPSEQIGIRIEDNYWVVGDGVVCLSEALPKHPDLVEQFMRGSDEDTEAERMH